MTFGFRRQARTVTPTPVRSLSERLAGTWTAITSIMHNAALTDAEKVREILGLTRQLPTGLDVNLDKVRSFAASAGDTITDGESYRVICNIVWSL